MIETADVGPAAPHLFLTLHHLVAQAAFLLHVLRASLCMHFSKTYQQLLLTLPPELRDSAIEYHKLKKLINQVVTELTSLGEYSGIFPSIMGTKGDYRACSGDFTRCAAARECGADGTEDGQG